MEFGYTSSLFEREVRKDIEKRRSELAIQIVSGSGVADWAAHRHLQGYVAAFDEALQIMDAARERLIKPQD